MPGYNNIIFQFSDSVDSDWSAHYSPVYSDEDDDELTISSMDMDCTSETHILVDAYNDLVNDGDLFKESLKGIQNIF